MTFKLDPNALLRKEVICRLYDSIENIKEERFNDYEKSKSRKSLEEHIAYQKCLFFLEYSFHQIKEREQEFYRGKHIYLFLDLLHVEMKHCFRAKHYISQINYEIHFEIYGDMAKMIEAVFVNKNHLRKKDIIRWEEEKIKRMILV